MQAGIHQFGLQEGEENTQIWQDDKVKLSHEELKDWLHSGQIDVLRMN